MYHAFRGGCGTRHLSSYVMSRPEGLPTFVLLIIRTHGVFQIADRQYQALPGSALILTPHTPYSYSNPMGEYSDDWLHFSVDDKDAFLELFPYVNQPFFIGGTENYTTFIRQILWELFYSPQIYAAQNIDALFGILINHLLTCQQGNAHSPSVIPYMTQLQTMRLEIQNNLANTPTIAKCAASIGISESYFQHLYTEAFGNSFQKDIIEFRIEHAKNILLTTNLSMEQIAEICGYNSPVHFYRQFKKIVGITPARFRKNTLIYSI